MIDVEELTITNISQKYWNKTGIDITFKLNNEWFELHVRKDKEGVFHPDEIYHLSGITPDCTYCDGYKVECSELRKYKKDFFERLIQMPSIRLQWLYLPHAVQA